MMPRWHHSDSSKAMSNEHDSVKKKTLELNSRSNLFSAGLMTGMSGTYDHMTSLRDVRSDLSITSVSSSPYIQLNLFV